MQYYDTLGIITMITERTDPSIHMKYLQIRSDIADGLKDGRYPAGQKIPSVRNLSAEFNVSIATVRHALSLLVQEGLIVKVPGRGMFATQSDPAGNNSNNASCSTIALVIVDNLIHNPFGELAPRHVEDWIRTLDKHLAKYGRSLIVAHTDTYSLAEGKLPTALENGLAGGVLVSGFVEDYHISQLQNTGLPVVEIGNRPILLPVSKVSIDCFKTSYLVTQALLSVSTGLVHFFTAPMELYYERQILQGYYQACHDLERDASVVMFDYTTRGAARLRDAISKLEDDCALVLNYGIGYLLGDTTQGRQLDLGQLPVAAFDVPYGINPSLIRRLNINKLGAGLPEEIAVEIMEELLAGGEPRTVNLEPEIITRESDGILQLDLVFKKPE